MKQSIYKYKWMLEPGAFIQGRYKIIRQIGQGGMGAVYEAIDSRLKSTVALKQMIVSGERLDRAFEREAQLLANLRHPALPKVIDYFFEDDAKFLVMEFIPGEDLGELMEREIGPFPLRDVLHWADLLLDALDYLHSQTPPVIHRDIKPQNLKFTARGEIILLDFGLAKGSVVSSQSVTNRSIVGYTPQYAPLEQIKGAGTDSRSDLYSFAATIYHLLTGQPPANALERASEVINQKPDPLVPAHRINLLVPADVSSLLAQALALDPSKRFKSAAAMRAAIKASSQPQSNSNVTTRKDEAERNLRNQVADLNDPLTQSGTGAATSPAAIDAATSAAGAGQKLNSAVGHSISITSTQQNRGMKRWFIISGFVVPLVVVAVLVFVLLRAREPENKLASAAKKNEPAAAAPATLTEAANNEVKVGSDTYKVLSAELERESEDKLVARFMIRVTHIGEYGEGVNQSHFRLLADGATLAPSNYPNELISPYSAKDIAVNFEIPLETKSMELQVGKIGEKTNRIALNITALLNQSKPPVSEPPAQRRVYPVTLQSDDEVKAGDDTYKILSAELDRHSDGMMAVKFKVRVTNGGPYGIGVADSFFRLIADGVPRAPEEPPNELVEAGSSKDVDMLFVVAETTAAIELQVGRVGGNTTRIPINIQ